jgi:hypothetical protein
MDEAAELESLRVISPQASRVDEGGTAWVLLPTTRVQGPTGVAVMDTVLCPLGQGGYTTRLLLERRVDGKDNLNWTTLVALGRTWHTWSWQNIAANQPWLQIFREHARALR